LCNVPGKVAVVLGAIDQWLVERFDGVGEDKVAPEVLSAIEALYFQQRGGKLGRTVLMVDEISKAEFASGGNSKLLADVQERLRSDKHVHEQAAYRIVADFVDAESTWLSPAFGRRGAVITALDYIDPGSEISKSGRSLLWLPLGTFDVWRDAAQSAIAGDAKRLGVLGDGELVHDAVWSLLAATGGRPRDILSILVSLQSAQADLQSPRLGALTAAFFAVGEKSPLFPQYLLPSILKLPFSLFGKR
jgi:hypothetical protein